MTNGCLNDVKTMGAITVSRPGGLRQRLVFGEAASLKYSIHPGREKVDGRFRDVNDDLSGGIAFFKSRKRKEDRS